MQYIDLAGQQFSLLEIGTVLSPAAVWSIHVRMFFKPKKSLRGNAEHMGDTSQLGASHMMYVGEDGRVPKQIKQTSKALLRAGR